MNATQQRFLLDRLDEARRGKPSTYAEVSFAETAKVKRAKKQKESAERVISKWEKARDIARKSRNEKIQYAFNLAKSAVLFKDSSTAIKAIEAFERMRF